MDLTVNPPVCIGFGININNNTGSIRVDPPLGAHGDRSAGANPLPIARTVIPAPVTYRGMPSPRWWELEDAAVDFDAVDSEPQDLARRLLLEFAVSYGNDWFVIPVDLPMGSICRIHSLIVTGAIAFRRGATFRQDGSLALQSAQGRVLMPNPQDKLDIYEEEIPREGVRVTRTYQYARWLDGAPLL